MTNLTAEQSVEVAVLVREALLQMVETADEWDSAEDLQERYAALRGAYVALRPGHVSMFSDFESLPALIADRREGRRQTEGFFSVVKE